MEQLAKNRNIGCIEKCKNGCVHLNIVNGITLYFATDAFLSLALLVNTAASKIMNEALAELLVERPEGEVDK